MLTKSDLKAIEQLIKPVRDDIAAVKNHNVRIENNLAKLESTVEKKLTKLNDIFVQKLDPFLKRVQTAEEENAILQAKEEGRSETRDELDERIKKLEDIHPDHRHETL